MPCSSINPSKICSATCGSNAHITSPSLARAPPR